MNNLRMYKEAEYMLRNRCTLRECAKIFGVHHNTVHRDVTKMLEQYDYEMYLKIRELLDYNLEQRASRGAMATHIKYKGGKYEPR